jgi:hypothetical protein
MIPQPIINNIIKNYRTNTLRSVVFGGGLAYSVSNGYWHHMPLIFLNPFAYASYQVFMSQGLFIDWAKTTVKALR